jgi:hypothetical protein
MGGRAIVVGDPHQSLYRFRGADAQAFPRISAMLERSKRGLVVLDLPINYRCDEKIILNSQRWVPEICGNNKAQGTVGTVSFGEAMERANNNNVDISLPDGIGGTERALPLPTKKEVSFAFLCRINLPLIITAYQLIAQGKRVCIIGRSQIGGPLKRIIQDLCGEREGEAGYTNYIGDLTDEQGRVIEQGMMSRLANYYEVQRNKLQDEKYKKKLEALQQNIECIEVIATRVQDDKVSSVVAEIDKLFTDEPLPGVISLSTVHRAKGLEWDVVFILRPDLMPHPYATSEEEMQQEMNCCYVAATRARHRLYYVQNWPFGSGSGKLNWTAPEGVESEKTVAIRKPMQPVKFNPPPEPMPKLQELKPFVDNGEPF